MLPDEMINNISTYLNDQDFRSLRNTCTRYREIKYIPPRTIITGVKNTRNFSIRANRCLFSIACMTMSYVGIIFLVISIALLSIGYNKEHIVFGTTLMVLSFVLLLVDLMFVLISIKITNRKTPIMSMV